MSDDFNPYKEMIFDDITRVEVPVTIWKKKYILVEASEEAHCKWRNFQIAQAKISRTGKVEGIGNVADSEPLLVSLCLYYADENGRLPVNKDGDPSPKFLVPLQKIKAWPSRVVSPLFERLKKISKIDEVVEKQEVLISDDDTPETLEEKILKLKEKREELLQTDRDPQLQEDGDRWEGSDSDLGVIGRRISGEADPTRNSQYDTMDTLDSPVI
jgi:hypothetical protein